MGKRIWKKPETIAYKRALRRSAARMALDLERLADPQKRDVTWESYLKNKIAKKERVYELTSAAMEKMPAKVEQFKVWQKEFLSRMDTIVTATNRLIGQLYKNRENSKLTNRIVNNLELVLDENIAYLTQLERFKKKMPITQVSFIKHSIQKTEHYCIHLLKKIKQYKRYITESEQEE